MVAPELGVVRRTYAAPALSVQRSPSGSALGWVAVAGWLGLLVAGWHAARRSLRSQRFGAVVVLFLLGQLALHAVYGRETFLYALDYLPALVALAALGTRGPHRRAVLAATEAVAAAAGVTNVRQFQRAAAFVAAEARAHPTASAPAVAWTAAATSAATTAAARRSMNTRGPALSL